LTQTRAAACCLVVTLGILHGVADSGLWAQEPVPETPVPEISVPQTPVPQAPGTQAPVRETPLRVTPSVATAQEYDSNLFATSVGPQSDFMTRVSPGIEAEYRSTPLTFLGKYVLDVERFERHPQLTTADGGQHASIDLRYSSSPRFTSSVNAAYTRTQTPDELSLVSGLSFARALAEHVELHPTFTGRFNSVTETIVGYELTDDRLAGGVDARTHRGSVRVERRLSPRNLIGVGYEIRHYSFAADTFPSVPLSAVGNPLTSHAIGLAWSGQVTQLTSVVLRGGPVLTGGTPTPELSASIVYRSRQSEASITYARTQTTVLGLAGLADARSITGEVAYSPRLGLRLRVLPGVFSTVRESGQADVYRVAFEAEQRIGKQLALRASYETTTQRGFLQPTALADPISRRHMLVSVVVDKSIPRVIDAVPNGPRPLTGN
jgi:hypothetical protein